VTLFKLLDTCFYHMYWKLYFMQIWMAFLAFQYISNQRSLRYHLLYGDSSDVFASSFYAIENQSVQCDYNSFEVFPFQIEKQITRHFNYICIWFLCALRMYNELRLEINHMVNNRIVKSSRKSHTQYATYATYKYI